MSDEEIRALTDRIMELFAEFNRLTDESIAHARKNDPTFQKFMNKLRMTSDL